MYPAGGLQFRDPFEFVGNVIADGVCRLFVTESGRNVFADEPRIAVNHDNADFPNYRHPSHAGHALYNGGSLEQTFAFADEIFRRYTFGELSSRTSGMSVIKGLVSPEFIGALSFQQIFGELAKFREHGAIYYDG